jgi:hypothetical protein
MTIENSLDRKMRGRLPHLPLGYDDHHLNSRRMPEIILDLQWASILFEPCVLNEHAWLSVEFFEGKKDREDFCDCFHLDFLVVGEGTIFPSPFVSFRREALPLHRRL